MGFSVGGGSINWRNPNCLMTLCWAISSTCISKMIFDFVIQYAPSLVQRIEIPLGYLDNMASWVYGSHITELPSNTSNCSFIAG
jgi:hypothetical protein